MPSHKDADCEQLFYFNLILWRPTTNSRLKHVAIATNQMNAIDHTQHDFPDWVIIGMSPAYAEFKK